MKKLFLIIITFLIIFPLFAMTDMYSYTISAYKQAQSIGVPEVSIRLITNSGEQFYSSSNPSGTTPVIQLHNVPEVKIFSWILSGNKLDDVTMQLEFDRLKNDATGIINYELSLVHEITKIGNMIVPLNEPSNIETNYHGYIFNYSDEVTVDNQSGLSSNLIVDSDNTSIDFDYSFTNSKPNDYTGTTCDYWNRTGSVYLTLDLPANPESGLYFADVILRFTVD